MQLRRIHITDRNTARAWKFEPLEDITAHEFATLFPYFSSVELGKELLEIIYSDSPLNRHFKLYDL